MSRLQKIGDRFSRVHLLLFTLFLGLLVVNDLFLKGLYPGWWTGKLSDFSGLLIFPIVVFALTGWKQKHIIWLTIGGFLFWKSGLSQPLIDGWNAIMPVHLSRVIDYSDLIALLMVPFSFRILLKQNSSPTTSLTKPALLFFAAFWCIASNSDDIRFINPMQGESATDLHGMEITIPRNGMDDLRYQLRVINDSTIRINRDGTRQKWDANIRKYKDLYFVNRRHPIYPDEYYVITAFGISNDTIRNFTSIFSEKPYDMIVMEHSEKRRYFKKIDVIWSEANEQSIVLIDNTEEETYEAFKVLVARSRFGLIRR